MIPQIIALFAQSVTQPITLQIHMTQYVLGVEDTIAMDLPRNFFEMFLKELASIGKGVVPTFSWEPKNLSFYLYATEAYVRHSTLLQENTHFKEEV